jgi:hypothetical protein
LRPLTRLWASKPLIPADSSTVFTRMSHRRPLHWGQDVSPGAHGRARCNARHKSVQIPYASQAPEVVKNRLPRWKVGWQVAPRAPRSQDVEDRIENGTQGVGWRPFSFGLRREMALQTLPLHIRKIAGITRTHPSSLSQRFSPSFQNTVLEPLPLHP